MSAANIGDPFLLARYSLPSRLPSNARTLPNVYLTHQAGEKSEGYATVAAQGDGVHVLDLSTLHPAISHTLGPSTTFACPPATRITTVDGLRTCLTYVAVHSSPELSETESGTTVWLWEENISGGVMSSSASKQKKSTTVPFTVSNIYVPGDLPQHVIFAGKLGDLLLTDSNLGSPIHRRGDSSVDGSALQKHFIFSRSDCIFLPSRASSSAVVVAHLRRTDALRLALIEVSADGSWDEVEDVSIPLQDEDIIDASLSSSGFFSVLTRTGKWYPFQLEPTSSSILLKPLPDPLHLSSLSFISSPSASAPSPTSSEISILSLSSSHVLLAGISNSPSPELTLLIWDLQYPVLLASHTLPLPSSLERSPKKKGGGVRISLAPTIEGSEQVLIVLSPEAEAGGKGVSSVLVVPVSVPRVSTIKNAMGRAGAGARWLVRGSGGAAAEEDVALSQDQKGVLKAMTGQKRAEGVEGPFFAYVAAEEKKAKQKADGEVVFEWEFVKRVLEVVLPVAAPDGGAGSTNTVYSAKVVKELMNRRAVSSGMVKGGLIPALTAQKDWESIVQAFDAVNDLPESDILLPLPLLLSRSPSSSDAMQVDPTPSTNDAPSLQTYLALCVDYSTSPAAMRVALKQRLPEAEDLVQVLEVLDGWVGEWEAATSTVSQAVGRKDLPPLDKILAFLQTTLDASFLTLLAYAPSHPLLHALSSRLQHHLSSVSSLAPLRGPLEPFARAHAKAATQTQQSQGQGQGQGQVDWRKKRKAAREQAGMRVGLYQVEELVI